MVGTENVVAAYDDIVKKMANVFTVELVAEKSSGVSAYMVGTTECAVVLGNLVDTKAETARAEAELSHLENFLKSIEHKLSNARFVDNAPKSVVDLERKKKHDTEAKIASLKETLAVLRK